MATRGLPLREPPSAPRVRSTVAEPESSCVATLRRAEDAVTSTRSVMLRHEKRDAARPSRGCRHRYEKVLHANDGNAYGALGPGGGGFLDGDGFLSFLRRYSTEGAPRRIERGQPPTPRPQSRVRPCAPRLACAAPQVRRRPMRRGSPVPLRSGAARRSSGRLRQSRLSRPVRAHSIACVA